MKFLKPLVVSAVLCGGIAIGAGCTHDEADTNNPVVPSSASLMSAGNKEIAFTAPHDGVVYLRDDTANRVLYSTDVKKGQTVRYDPDSEQWTIDNAMAGDLIVGHNHKHSILFQPNRASESLAAGAVPGSNEANPTTRPSNFPVIHVPVGVKVEVQTQPTAGR